MRRRKPTQEDLWHEGSRIKSAYFEPDHDYRFTLAPDYEAPTYGAKKNDRITNAQAGKEK
mgnify:CR=1 FL=1